MNVDELRTALTRATARHGVPGAQVAVLTGGRLLTAAVGEREAGTGVAVTDETPFPIGSVTKPFTAALAMVLVDDGDVDLDEPLRSHLPEFGAGRVVTLRALLSHTGGLASNVSPEHRERTRRRWIAAHCGEEHLEHPPGAAFSYSNIGYIVIGHLVEVMLDMSWHEGVRSVLLHPFGIEPSFVDESGTSGPRTVAHGHNVAPGRIVPVPEQDVPAVEAPNGGLALSAADLVAFAGTFPPGREPPAPLPAPGFEAMCRDQLDAVGTGPHGMADGWGLGWARYGGPGEWWGHDGSGDGTACHVRLHPRTGTVVALTANASSGHALWAEFSDVLRAAGLPAAEPPPTRVASAVPLPAECLGRYRNGDSEYVVEQDGEGARLVADGRPFALCCGPDLRFDLRDPAAPGPGYSGRFLRQPTGGVDHLQISGRLARRSRLGRWSR